MATNKKPKKIVMDANELNQIVVDLKNILQSLSNVAAHLERRLSTYELSLFDNENCISLTGKQQEISESKQNNTSDNSDVQWNKSLLYAQKIKERPPEWKPGEEKKHVRAETASEIVSFLQTSHRSSIVVKDIKKRFEFASHTSHDSSAEDRKISSESASKNSDINVSVQNLKQKFESDKKDVQDDECNNINIENDRKNNQVKVKMEELSGYEDKVKKILKYFQPQP